MKFTGLYGSVFMFVQLTHGLNVCVLCSGNEAIWDLLYDETSQSIFFTEPFTHKISKISNISFVWERCGQGFYRNSSDVCVVCELGFYCDGFSGRQACAQNMETTSTGSTSMHDCLCKEGFFSTNGSACILCPAGYFCVSQSNESVSCTGGNTSVPGASYASDCFCRNASGYFLDSDSGMCMGCPPNMYCKVRASVYACKV